jgi:hypothetical protein
MFYIFLMKKQISTLTSEMYCGLHLIPLGSLSLMKYPIGIGHFIKKCPINYIGKLFFYCDIFGDSKLVWIRMATLYENICGNCVGRIELTFI